MGVLRRNRTFDANKYDFFSMYNNVIMYVYMYLDIMFIYSPYYIYTYIRNTHYIYIYTTSLNLTARSRPLQPCEKECGASLGGVLRAFAMPYRIVQARARGGKCMGMLWNGTQSSDLVTKVYAKVQKSQEESSLISHHLWDLLAKDQLCCRIFCKASLSVRCAVPCFCSCGGRSTSLETFIFICRLHKLHTVDLLM